jgi:transposase
MWTTENRGRYDRSKLRYPSDLTDEEWWLVGPLIPAAKRGGNKRTIDVREVVNGIMYILSTGCQWAALPKDLPTAQHGQQLFPALCTIALLAESHCGERFRYYGCDTQH